MKRPGQRGPRHPTTGARSFTFELQVSETPKDGFSYVTLRDHAFTVTGGTVTNPRRLEPGKNVRWEIAVKPDPATLSVTVVLPVTTDCEAQGVSLHRKTAGCCPAGWS